MSTLVSTNMAWPDDPYGTGQLWRKEPQLLAAFAVAWGRFEGDLRPAAYAAVYLRLQRTASVAIDESLKFGFRTVAAQQQSDVPQLVSVLDLDVLRAQRLAKVLVGWRLAENLRAASQHASKGTTSRGLTAVAQQSNDGSPRAQGMAIIVDLSADLTSTKPEFGESSSAFLRNEIDPMRQDPSRRLTWAPGTGADVPDVDDGDCPVRSDLIEPVLRRAFVLAICGGIQLQRCSWQDGASLNDILSANTDGCF